MAGERDHELDPGPTLGTRRSGLGIRLSGSEIRRMRPELPSSESRAPSPESNAYRVGVMTGYAALAILAMTLVPRGAGGAETGPDTAAAAGVHG